MTQNEFNVVLEQQYRKCADVLAHTRFKNCRQKCGSNSPQPGSEKSKDTGTRIINHFTKEELQYDTK